MIDRTREAGNLLFFVHGTQMEYIARTMYVRTHVIAEKYVFLPSPFFFHFICLVARSDQFFTLKWRSVIYDEEMQLFTVLTTAILIFWCIHLYPRFIFYIIVVLSFLFLKKYLSFVDQYYPPLSGVFLLSEWEEKSLTPFFPLTALLYFRTAKEKKLENSPRMTTEVSNEWWNEVP